MAKLKTDDLSAIKTWHPTEAGHVICGKLIACKSVKTREYGDQMVYRIDVKGEPWDVWGAVALDALMAQHAKDLIGKAIVITMTGLGADGRTKMFEIDDSPAPEMAGVVKGAPPRKERAPGANDGLPF